MIKIFDIDIITPVEHPGGFQLFLAHADVVWKETRKKTSAAADCLIAKPRVQGISRLFLSGILIRTVNRFLSMEAECKTFSLGSHFSAPFYGYRGRLLLIFVSKGGD